MNGAPRTWRAAAAPGILRAPLPLHAYLRKSLIMNAAINSQDVTEALREDSQEVLQAVAEFFSVLSTPVRLSILHAVCEQERTVSEILSFVGASQSNVSQHLAVLYRAGILGRRRDGNQIYYFIKSTQALGVCKGVCQQFMQEFAAQKQAGKTG